MKPTFLYQFTFEGLRALVIATGIGQAQVLLAHEMGQEWRSADDEKIHEFGVPFKPQFLTCETWAEARSRRLGIKATQTGRYSGRVTNDSSDRVSRSMNPGEKKS